METVGQLANRILGKKALMTILSWTDRETGNKSLGIEVPVTVVDIRIAYGRPQFLIAPFKGRGTAWVDEVRLEVYDWDITDETVEIEALEPRQDDNVASPAAT